MLDMALRLQAITDMGAALHLRLITVDMAATAGVEVETTGDMEVAEVVVATIPVVPGGEEGTVDTPLMITPTQITETVEVMKIPIGVLIISLRGHGDVDGKKTL
jgi:hypothetical protein